MTQSHILFIHERRGRLGGAEEYVLALAHELAKNDSIDLCYEQDCGENSEEFDRAFCKQFPSTKLGTYLDQTPPKLVIFHKCLNTSIIDQVMAHHIPTLRFVHDHEVYSMRHYRIWPWSKPIDHRPHFWNRLGQLKRDPTSLLGMRWKSFGETQKLVQKDQQLDRFIVGSTFMREELLSQGYAGQRIRIIPPITHALTPVSKQELKTNNKILYVGRIDRGKGLDYLLKALAKVKHPFQLIVAGDGPFADHCKKLTQQLSLSDCVSFRGFLSREAIDALYKDAALVVVPSVWPEPFGMVGIEAMAHALPVIAFDTGGIKDWLIDGYNGYLVPWTNVKAMAEKIEFLLVDKDTASKLGQSGQQLLCDRFSYEQAMQEVKNVIQEII